jgi:hypothetical protein
MSAVWATDKPRDDAFWFNRRAFDCGSACLADVDSD